MDTVAPEPTTILDGDTLWVAYRPFDPNFPGWGNPATDEYLERTRGLESFGALVFGGVASHSLGPPNDERIHEHPLWGSGLRTYRFHRLDRRGAPTRWIVTFHDETLDVTADSATASALTFAANALEAIEIMRHGVPPEAEGS